MPVLVTGASGYIGSHVAFELLETGYDVVTVGNFLHSEPGVLFAFFKSHQMAPDSRFLFVESATLQESQFPS